MSQILGRGEEAQRAFNQGTITGSTTFNKGKTTIELIEPTLFVKMFFAQQNFVRVSASPSTLSGQRGQISPTITGASRLLRIFLPECPGRLETKHGEKI